jgi:hypothetical protein
MHSSAMRELVDLASGPQLQRIGAAALLAHITDSGLEETVVQESQNRVGPGATQDARQAARGARSHLLEVITDVLGELANGRDDLVLQRAIAERVDDDETVIVQRLGRELTDRDRYRLQFLRVQRDRPGEQTSATEARHKLAKAHHALPMSGAGPGVSGATEKIEPLANDGPTDPVQGGV